MVMLDWLGLTHLHFRYVMYNANYAKHKPKQWCK